MTNDDLRKAADAVTQAAQEFPGDLWCSQKTVTAVDELATHVQRMYDPTPVDIDWLNSLRRADGEDIAFMGVMQCDDGLHLMGMGGYVAPNVATRGDVRRLCEVMGIELKGGAL